MILQNETKYLDLLLVEDNPADIRLTKEVLKDYKFIKSISIVRDGVEALEYLHKTGAFVNATTPDIVLLDLNLPKKDGKEVLREIKNDPELKCIPVLVLTTSSSHIDIQKAYSLHANCYLVKPVSLDRFAEVVKGIEEFWLKLVTLPRKNQSFD